MVWEVKEEEVETWMVYLTMLEATESDWVNDNNGWVEVDQEPLTNEVGPREEGLSGAEQLEVVWVNEEVADVVPSPFLYWTVYEYDVPQIRFVLAQELVVIQPELELLVVFVKL